MNYIDIIILVFIGLILLEGFKKGLIKMTFETLGLIIAFFISKQYSYIVEEFLLNRTKLYLIVHDFFQNKAQWLTQMIQEGTTDVVAKFKEIIKLPQEMQMIFIDSFKDGAVNNFDMFVNNISDFIVKSISFLVTFLIVYLLLLIICNIADTILKLPLLNLTNKIGGCIIGIVKGVLILYLVFALSSPLIAFMPENNIVKNITESKSHEFFYDKNIILNYLSYKGFYE
ncbi:CvpA family protein [Sedimentibacter sp. zth1]|uniref:CvpA family protein n=1 Tax=Sedimentibacter sp. zth1 TaxID=2816908 RepID=UPI001A9326F5|nr:CvpA family protein [Sedimentibacter sp. zth1]QSX05196.1 CvpA family protein [Sedimentibacter sp. zth1]